MGGIFNNSYLPGQKAGTKLGNPLIPVEVTDRDVILPTVLRVGKEELDYWTNMTCFYDKQWEFNPKLSTTPICFMHITSVAETTTAQGSEKRVILYEAPPGAEQFSDPNITSHPAYRNNLEVIVDNVVVQPRSYQMEIIIPETLIGPYHRQGLSRLNAIIEYLQRTDSDIMGMETIKNSIQFAQSAIDIFQTASEVADTVLGLAGSSSQMSTINKNSLDAMVSAGHVVCFKKWTGYDYVYGLITKVDISKRPSENGIYRGSITFQETPILNISPKRFKKKLGADATALERAAFFIDTASEAAGYGAAQAARVLNLALAYPFIQLTGVMEEAGAPGSDTADGGTGYDIFFS